MFLFSEDPAFETGTLQNTQPGFHGLQGERGQKGNQGLKGIKGDFVPLGFLLPKLPGEGFLGNEQTNNFRNLKRSDLGS